MVDDLTSRGRLLVLAVHTQLRFSVGLAAVPALDVSDHTLGRAAFDLAVGLGAAVRHRSGSGVVLVGQLVRHTQEYTLSYSRAQIRLVPRGTTPDQ